MSDEGATATAPRSRSTRRRDTEQRLGHDVDLWVATASVGGVPHLVPLSFDWDGETVLLATPSTSPTGRNLAASGTVRLGLGPTRDVTMLEGDVEAVPLGDLPGAAADRFVARTGFDPRAEGGTYAWYRVRPRRIQSWREADELAGRDLMRDGVWLADAAAGEGR
jgi:hypothetical protein